MIAMRLKSRLPAETAEDNAANSAQIVEPIDAFSILQPVNTEPSLHSIAAPTLYREYGEYEFSMTSVAALMSFLSVIMIILQFI